MNDEDSQLSNEISWMMMSESNIIAAQIHYSICQLLLHLELAEMHLQYGYMDSAEDTRSEIA